MSGQRLSEAPWRGRIYGEIGLVVVLLAAHVFLAMSAARGKSNVYDEVTHLGSGYSGWVTGDYRLNAESGLLAHRWMALPLLLGKYRYPSLDQPAWYGSETWEMGKQFFFAMGNDADEMFWRGRLAVVFLSLLLGALVWFWSRRLFGWAGGLVSLCLYAFSPATLAHGALATVDMPAAFVFLLGVSAFWACLRKVTPWRVLGSCVAISALLLTKMSAVTIVPMLLLMLIVRLVAREPLPVAAGGKKWVVPHRGRQAAVLAGVVLLHLVVAVLLIWAAYGMRFSAFRNAVPGRDMLFLEKELFLEDGTVPRIVARVRDHRLLPESYLYGFLFIYRSTLGRLAFLNGKYSIFGWRWFFPYCWAVKTPLGLFAVFLLAAAAWLKLPLRSGTPDAHSRPAWRGILYRATPVWVLMVGYWAMAVLSHINIGERHLLPAYAPMYILAGTAGYWLTAKGRLLRALTATMLLAVMLETVAAWPNYLAYFNILAGGSSQGYRHLVDSSLDWGQDLRGLKTWLDRHAAREPNVYVAYFGSASPTYYGINARFLPVAASEDLYRLAPPEVTPLQAGVYCISATVLQQVASELTGPWTESYEKIYRQLLDTVRPLQGSPSARELFVREQGGQQWLSLCTSYGWYRLSRLCALLRAREPDDQVGHSILIYRLSEEEVRRAEYGAPAELLPSDGISR